MTEQIKNESEVKYEVQEYLKSEGFTIGRWLSVSFFTGNESNAKDDYDQLVNSHPECKFRIVRIESVRTVLEEA